MTLRIFQKGFHFSQDGPGNRLVYHLQGCNLRCPWCANPEGLCPEGGTEYTVDALVEEVLRSRMLFFEGGGVTLTGGEATLQFAAVREFLTRLHREEISIHASKSKCSDHASRLKPRSCAISSTRHRRRSPRASTASRKLVLASCQLSEIFLVCTDSTRCFCFSSSSCIVVCGSH